MRRPSRRQRRSGAGRRSVPSPWPLLRTLGAFRRLFPILALDNPATSACHAPPRFGEGLGRLSSRAGSAPPPIGAARAPPSGSVGAVGGTTCGPPGTLAWSPIGAARAPPSGSVGAVGGATCRPIARTGRTAFGAGAARPLGPVATSSSRGTSSSRPLVGTACRAPGALAGSPVGTPGPVGAVGGASGPIACSWGPALGPRTTGPLGPIASPGSRSGRGTSTRRSGSSCVGLTGSWSTLGEPGFTASGSGFTARGPGSGGAGTTWGSLIGVGRHGTADRNAAGA